MWYTYSICTIMLCLLIIHHYTCTDRQALFMNIIHIRMQVKVHCIIQSNVLTSKYLEGHTKSVLLSRSTD